MDPDNLPDGSKESMDFTKASKSDAKAWKDIWSAGQGVGSIDEILPARDVVLKFEQEYKSALAGLIAA